MTEMSARLKRLYAKRAAFDCWLGKWLAVVLASFAFVAVEREGTGLAVERAWELDGYR